MSLRQPRWCVVHDIVQVHLCCLPGEAGVEVETPSYSPCHRQSVYCTAPPFPTKVLVSLLTIFLLLLTVFLYTSLLTIFLLLLTVTLHITAHYLPLLLIVFTHRCSPSSFCCSLLLYTSRLPLPRQGAYQVLHHCSLSCFTHHSPFCFNHTVLLTTHHLASPTSVHCLADVADCLVLPTNAHHIY